MQAVDFIPNLLDRRSITFGNIGAFHVLAAMSGAGNLFSIRCLLPPDVVVLDNTTSFYNSLAYKRFPPPWAAGAGPDVSDSKRPRSHGVKSGPPGVGNWGATGYQQPAIVDAASRIWRRAARTRFAVVASSTRPGQRHSPGISHHAFAGVAGGDAGELALEGGSSGPAVQPFHFGGSSDERSIRCLCRTIDDKDAPGSVWNIAPITRSLLKSWAQPRARAG